LHIETGKHLDQKMWFLCIKLFWKEF
jgi:hypothetical protein